MDECKAGRTLTGNSQQALAYTRKASVGFNLEANHGGCHYEGFGGSYWNPDVLILQKTDRFSLLLEQQHLLLLHHGISQNWFTLLTASTVQYISVRVAICIHTAEAESVNPVDSGFERRHSIESCQYCKTTPVPPTTPVRYYAYMHSYLTRNRSSLLTYALQSICHTSEKTLVRQMAAGLTDLLVLLMSSNTTYATVLMKRQERNHR